MNISKNEVVFAAIWWPTRMLVQTAPNSFEFKLVKFGEKVAISPRKAMGAAAPNLSVRSESYFLEVWTDRVRSTFDTEPGLSVVSTSQIDEFVEYALSTKSYLKNTMPEDYVKEKFASILNL